VSDEASEEAALNALVGLDVLMRRNESGQFSQKVQLLRTVVEHRPRTIHGFSYRMSDPGDRFYEICHAIDLHEVLPSIADLWRVPDSKTREIAIGSFLAGTRLSIHTIPFNWEPPEFVWTEILPLFTHTQIVRNLIAGLTDTFPPNDAFLTRALSPDYLCFYRLVHDQIVRNAPFGPPPAAEMKRLRDIVLTRAPLPVRARYAARIGDLSLALSILPVIEDDRMRMEVFRREILATAIAYNFFGALQNALADHDDLFHAMEPVAGPHLHYYIEDHFQRHRRASQIAIDLFSKCRVPARSMTYLDLAQLALDGIQDKDDGDRLLLKGIDLQRQFLIASLGTDDPSVQDLNLFGSLEQQNAIVMWCFAEGEFRLGSTIVRAYGVDGRDIGGKLIKEQMLRNDAEMLAFLRGLQNGCGDGLFVEMIHPILLRIGFGPERKAALVLQASRMLKDPDFRCRILIEFGWLDEALVLAIDHGLLRLVPLIGNLAQNQLKPNIVAKCMKVLEAALK
jgi:hypothetical protein